MDCQMGQQDDDCSRHESPVTRRRLMQKQKLIGQLFWNVIPGLSLHPKHEHAIDCAYQTLNPKPEGEFS